MTAGRLFCLITAAGFLTNAAVAQSEDAGLDTPPAEDVVAEPGADEIADQLNSRQQLKQTFTLERRINGEVVETQKRTVVYSRDDPLRDSEAGLSPAEALKAQFEAELLTRTEALEEAKIFFALADKDRDDFMNVVEFAEAILVWTQDREQEASIAENLTPRERRMQEFLSELDREINRREAMQRARQKFSFMAGAALTMTQAEFIREYLLEFDSMDVDGDMLLKGDELTRFRALGRGESVETGAD